MTQTKQNKRFIFPFLWVLFVLVCYYPYEFWSMYFLFLPDKVHYSLAVFSASTVILGLIMRSEKKEMPRMLWSCVFMQAFGFFLVIVDHGQGITTFIDMYMPIITALILLLYIEGTSGAYDFFNKYDKWISIMAVMGFLTWILVTFAHFQPFYFVIERGGSEHVLFNYITTFTKSDSGSVDNLRYAGFFDEPGAMGYWGMYMLLFNQLFFKNKTIEKISIISLLFTFSMGFYIQLLAYFIFFKASGKFKNVIITGVIILILYFAMAQTKDTKLDFIYTATVERIDNMFLNADESGSVVAVDNRENYALNAKRQFEEHPLLGAPSGKDNMVFDNIYEPLAKYGIIGTFFIYSPFLFMLAFSIKKRDIMLLKGMLVMILGFTHRPFHNFLLYYFILYGFIIMYFNYGIVNEENSEAY